MGTLIVNQYLNKSSWVTDGLILGLESSSYSESVWTDLSSSGNDVDIFNTSLGEDGGVIFNGTSAYGQAFNPITPSRYTISSCFKPLGEPSNNDGNGGALFVMHPQNFNYIWLSYSWSNLRYVHFHNSALAVFNSSTSRNKTAEVAVTYDGVARRIYLNGSLVSSLAASTDPVYPTSGDIFPRIGKWGFSSFQRYFNGVIYSVRVYDRALTSPEIQKNYEVSQSLYNIVP